MKENPQFNPLFPYMPVSAESAILAPGKLLVDNFAGGGGASTGLGLALGRPVDIAINHDPEAIAMHQVNHPYSEHFCESVWEVDPRKATAGRPVALAWFSPDCKHFSKAAGGKPRSKNIRGLAWIKVRWAATVAPDVMITENVEEFLTWGPLRKDGQPDKAKAGRTFTSWVNALRKLGYEVEWRVLRACDYGAPTSRRRLFIIARRDGLPVVWPEPTHAAPSDPRVLAGALQPWRTVAECIDWTIPTQSIFNRSKPLVSNTLQRIAHGILRYTLQAQRPFVATCNHGGAGFRGMDVQKPAKTIMAAQDAHGLVSAQVVAQTRQNAARPLGEPLNTITTQSNAHTLVSAALAPCYSECEGQAPRAQSVTRPLPTITTGANAGRLVSVTLIKTDNQKSRSSCAYSPEHPLFTVVTKNNSAIVTAQMVRHNGGHCTPQTASYPASSPARTVTARGKPHDILTTHAVHLDAFYGSDARDPGQQVQQPLRTIPTRDRFAVTTAQIVRQQSNSIGYSAREPLATVMPECAGGKSYLLTAEASSGLTEEQQAGAERVYAFLLAQLGERLTLHADHAQRLVLLNLGGQLYVMTDICMRMLQPRELYRAQGFPEDYVIDFSRRGKPLSKEAQVRMCGNSVPPPFSKALAYANLTVQMQEAAD